MPYKIGIVGAARRKQGTGPFIARTFSELGNEIVGIVGTSPTSLGYALSVLRDHYNIDTPGYLSVKKLLNHTQVDALAICSPPDTHLQYLQQGLSAGLHIFCEKPLWWPNAFPPEFTLMEYENSLRPLLEEACEKGRIIHLNTQWTYTLQDFYKLYSSQLTTPLEVQQFAMDLCPQSKGLEMLVDTASHGLSMLYQLVGEGNISEIRCIKENHQDSEKWQIHFNYVHKKGTTRTKFGLTSSQGMPKPARYEINGLEVNRNVVLPDYQIQLQSKHSMMNIIDPLESSIRDFIASMDAATGCDETALMLGAKHLYTLIDACR